MMEVLNDFGLVSYFGLNVISTSIFQLWFNGNDLNAAARLGSIVVLLILLFLGGEIFLRKHPKYAYSTTQLKAIRQTPLSGLKKIVFYATSSLLWIVSLGLPLIQLGRWLLTIDFLRSVSLTMTPLLNTLLLGTLTAGSIILLALAVANVTRYQHLRVYRVFSRLLTFGYSLPGVLIAMAIFLFFMPIERWFISVRIPFSFHITTSITILVVALVIRYLAIGIQFIESAYQKIGLKFTQASYTLKQGKWLTLARVDIPMMAQSLVAAVLIILIDVFKELPLTLFLRPFNYDTLATRLYQFAGDEQLAESSPMIVVLWVLTALVVYGASHLMIKEDAYEFND
jgi:iron(III) transport system permease protein